MLSCDAPDYKENAGTNQYKKYSLEWRDEGADSQWSETLNVVHVSELGVHILKQKNITLLSIKDITPKKE